ncbi:hypothetical protein RhiirB3_533592 [Rhizophagus irregularis]|nr:hypothetical protein RhiirB3_533592 [Rhizophagus irregularis]
MEYIPYFIYGKYILNTSFFVFFYQKPNKYIYTTNSRTHELREIKLVLYGKYIQYEIFPLYELSLFDRKNTFIIL